MNAKRIITSLITILTFAIGKAQTQEVADSLTHELQEIVVTADRPTTKLVGSTLVSTISGTNLANLGNALDVLAQLPMIKVEDNNVSVIGKNDIEVYIDGRPMRDNMELTQILSSNLKKVELLMAPGAEYESTTDAVLRITTKRSFMQGLSFTDQFQLQQRRKMSVMDYIALNYRTDRWELFVNGTVNHNNSLAKGSTTNTLMNDGRETVVGSSQYNSYPTTVGAVKAGANYAKDHQSFGTYYRYNPEHADFNNYGTEWLNDDNSVLKREIDKRIRSHSHLLSVYYENTISDRFLLHFDGDFRHSVSTNRVITSYPESTYSAVNSNDERKSTIWAGKLYLNMPLWGGDFTIGTQDSHTHTTLDYRMLNAHVGEYIPSSMTDAKQISATLFASWSRTFDKFTVSAGARYEYKDYDFKIDDKRNESLSQCNHLLTPDISLGYSFNDESQVSISYKMATVKPPYSQLTGSLNYVGIHEIEGGNQALRDERMHDIQLFGMWKGFMLQTDFTRSLDTYAYAKQLYPASDLQLLMHPINIDVSAISMYLIWSRPVRCWTPDVTIGVYRQWLTLNNSRYDKPIFSYYFNNTLSLPCGWMITANISGRTQGDMHTNRFGTTWFTMDASIGKTFLNNSLTIKLSATDIFNTANNSWTMDTYGVFVDKRQSYDRRGLSLNVIYNYNPVKTKYRGKNASESEMNRL